ncbi:hypothetical protein NDU88_001596 [Pleurodeles waltl]|uniref:Uncharacterized protein n=1 Tax=Pleurodeles waltl TaxID=8319 RepID=A0AAV7P982_PLEWA|nr:hypothetical protein NDU88_001596 [Pleurodeles waltl]
MASRELIAVYQNDRVSAWTGPACGRSKVGRASGCRLADFIAHQTNINPRQVPAAPSWLLSNTGWARARGNRFSEDTEATRGAGPSVHVRSDYFLWRVSAF